MAAAKFADEADPQAAFAALLSTHVLSSPVAQGIAQAVAAGLISVEPGGQLHQLHVESHKLK
jgi:hypothetical protein